MKTKVSIAFICLLLVLAVLMPYKTTVTTETLSSVRTDGKNYPEGLSETLSNHLFDSESYPTFADSIYIIQEEYLIKKDKTTFFIPYITADVRTVWTAGSCPWEFWLNTLMVKEDGTTIIKANKKYNRSASTFIIEPDPNTYVRDRFGGHFFESTAVIVLDKWEWSAAEDHVFSIEAVTLDSSKHRNADSVVSFKWESALTYGIGKKVPFVVNANTSYINNYKAPPSYSTGGAPLTAEELDYFREYASSQRTEYIEEWGGYNTSATEISCFFTSQYNDPRDMDAKSFLYYCPDQGTLELEDEAEWQLVQKKVDWRVGKDNRLATVGELPVPVHRLPRTYINEILTEYAGITVEEMHTDWLTEALYLSETDCFYTFSSDFGPGTFYPYYGEKKNDIVTLWEEPAGYDGSTSMLTLQKNGENWHILSHQSTPETT